MTCALILATGCGASEEGGLWAEPALDFGAMTAGATQVRTVRLRNERGTPVTVTGLDLAPVDAWDGRFELVDPPPLPADVPPGGTLEIGVAFTAAGTRRAGTALRWTAVPSEDSGSVLLSGRGAGPALTVQPRVVFDVVQVGESSERILEVTNAGTAPMAVDVSVVEGEVFSVAEADRAFRLPLGATRPIPVIFEPSVSGLERGQLRIATDAGFETQVALEGPAAPDPACRLEIRPERLDFGYRDSASFALANVGEVADCFVWDATTWVEEGADLEVLAAPRGAIAPGRSAEVRLGFEPHRLGGTWTGWIRFRTSDPEQPVVEVPVEGASRDTLWLFIAPSDFDFGDAVVGGPGKEQDFCVYNDTSGIDVVLAGLRWRDDAAGGAFTVVSDVAGATIAGDGRVCWRVRFKPHAAGLFEAALLVDVEVDVEGLEEPVLPYLVTLQGEGVGG